MQARNDIPAQGRDQEVFFVYDKTKNLLWGNPGGRPGLSPRIQKETGTHLDVHLENPGLSTLTQDKIPQKRFLAEQGLLSNANNCS